MPKPRLVIEGASGHGKVVADIVRKQGIYELVAVCDPAKPHEHLFGVPVVATADEAVALGADHVLLAIGDNSARLQRAAEYAAHGLRFGVAVHPSAVLAEGARLHDGAVVCAGAIVGPDASVGPHTILNTAATVDHDCVLEAGVHVGPGAHLGGTVHVGEATWIGIGACVRNNLVIGARTMIGAGAVVVGDIPAGVTAYGVPARVVGASPFAPAG